MKMEKYFFLKKNIYIYIYIIVFILLINLKYKNLINKKGKIF